LLPLQLLLLLLLFFAEVRVSARLLGRGHDRCLVGGAGRTRRELLLVLVGPVKRLLLVTLRLRRLLGGRLRGRCSRRPTGGGLAWLRGGLLLRTGGIGAGRVVGRRRPPLVWVLLVGGAVRLKRWIHGPRLVLRAGELRLIEVGRARVLLLVVVRSLLLRVACNREMVA